MKLFTSLLLLLLLNACGSGDSAAERASEDATLAAQEAAYQSMMDGHDRVMPLMGKITQAQRTITEQLAAGGVTEEYRDLLLAANEQLEDANDGMMNWMNGIRPLDELRAEMKADNMMEHVKEQTASIAQIEADMKASLANAERILNDEIHDHGDGTDHEHK
ncbi:hypothetical protein GGR28_003559 [Lewinella aquimaris]|uniref:Uncharacterized protein n=1 Tax=Neolewinella aquimaris TaxID=1835722 RepID=A0A840E7A6_9BACT|nr:hypothetical protein [Neolewinella aquimaris]MBB4080920.1 hypothetical protein [Neolewinella aquimaris]